MTEQAKLETTWNDLRRAWLRGMEDLPAARTEDTAPLRFRHVRARRAAAAFFVPAPRAVQNPAAG
jgi:hypothetical protein